jgi:HSP20 family molecular chaperone IbpA
MYMMPFNSFHDSFSDIMNPVDSLFERVVNNIPAKIMPTDVTEEGDTYKLTIDVPGVKKENIKIELNDGYLKISTYSDSSSEEKDESGKCIKKERYSGSSSRSFYVGDEITHDDIKAKIENGTLILSFPKIKEEPQKKFIEIE